MKKKKLKFSFFPSLIENLYKQPCGGLLQVK